MNKKDKLDIKLEKSLAFQIDYTANFTKTFRRAFHRKIMNSDISLDEFAILCLIENRPDITQAALGRYLFKGKAHIGKILNILEEKGFLKRVCIENSNTTKNIISKKGEQILAEGLFQVKKIENATHESFSKEELLQFFSYLKRYRQTLDSIVEVKIK